MEKEQKKPLQRIGKVIEKNVKSELLIVESTDTGNWTNYEGSRPYKHMGDDVKVRTKSDSMGNSYVIVSGGKLTAFKWHIVNDGSYDSKTGRRIPATHFVEKAIKKSETDINRIVDGLLARVANGR